uniref:Uncharacterized protein n=1 Tax=Arion vulgaris TaxID=1028688 RepID=A0A0B7BLC0_9EUPU
MEFFLPVAALQLIQPQLSGKTLESKGSRRDVDHITDRLPTFNEKYGPNTDRITLHILRYTNGYLTFTFYTAMC